MTPYWVSVKLSNGTLFTVVCETRQLSRFTILFPQVKVQLFRIYPNSAELLHLVQTVQVELELVVDTQHRCFHHAVPEEVGVEERAGNHVVFDHTGILEYQHWKGTENVCLLWQNRKINMSCLDVQLRKPRFMKLSQRQKADFNVTVRVRVNPFPYLEISANYESVITLLSLPIVQFLHTAEMQLRFIYIPAATIKNYQRCCTETLTLPLP